MIYDSFFFFVSTWSWKLFWHCPVVSGCAGDGWEPFRRKCYKVIDKFCNWNGAHAACTKAGGRFALVGSQEVNRLLKAALTRKDGSKIRTVWLGLRWDDGKWAWTGKDNQGVSQSLKFTDWKSGEPSKRECAVYTHGHDEKGSGSWSTQPCSEIIGAVFCEKGKNWIKWRGREWWRKRKWEKEREGKRGKKRVKDGEKDKARKKERKRGVGWKRKGTIGSVCYTIRFPGILKIDLNWRYCPNHNIYLCNWFEIHTTWKRAQLCFLKFLRTCYHWSRWMHFAIKVHKVCWQFLFSFEFGEKMDSTAERGR